MNLLNNNVDQNSCQDASLQLAKSDGSSVMLEPMDDFEDTEKTLCVLGSRNKQDEIVTTSSEFSETETSPKLKPENVNSNTCQSDSGSETEKRYRPQKYCAVCGDKAIACNFNAVTCESCKAFFRRNAYKDPRLKCLFEGKCIIDKVTRRFCSRCRLDKCFFIGMKREWILTDEQKRVKRNKIIQNKQIRQQGINSPALASICPSGTQCHRLELPSTHDNITAIDTKSTRLSPLKGIETRDVATNCTIDEFEPHMEISDLRHQPHCSFVSKCQFCSLRLTASMCQTSPNQRSQPALLIDYRQTGGYIASAHHFHSQISPSSAHPTGQHSLLGSTLQQTPSPVTDISNMMFDPMHDRSGASQLSMQTNSPGPVMSHNSLQSQTGRAICSLTQSSVSPSNNFCYTDPQQVPSHQQVNGLNLRQYQSRHQANNQQQVSHHLMGFSQPQLHELQVSQVPLLSEHTRVSMTNPAHSIGTVGLPNIPVKSQVCGASVRLLTNQINCSQAQEGQLGPIDVPQRNFNPHQLDRPFDGAISDKRFMSMGLRDSCDDTNLARPIQFPLQTPVRTKTEPDFEDQRIKGSNGTETSNISEQSHEALSEKDCEDALMTNGTTSEPSDSSDFVIYGSQSYAQPADTQEELEKRLKTLDFNDSERCLIDELLDGTKFVFEQRDHTTKLMNTLDDIVNICDSVLRGLIKKFKQIKAFKTLCVDDQILLSKAACFKILLLRSTLHYRDELDGWVDAKTGRIMSLDILKRAKKSSVYERHKELIQTLPSPLRRDRFIMSVLSLALLFDPGINLRHSRSVHLDYLTYLNMLRKYLLETQPDPLTKYEALMKTIEKLNACNEEYNVFFSKDFQPEQITPLLLEIFDISLNNS